MARETIWCVLLDSSKMQCIDLLLSICRTWQKKPPNLHWIPRQPVFRRRWWKTLCYLTAEMQDWPADACSGKYIDRNGKTILAVYTKHILDSVYNSEVHRLHSSPIVYDLIHLSYRQSILLPVHVASVVIPSSMLSTPGIDNCTCNMDY